MTGKSPLTFKVVSKCSTSKARRGLMMLRETKPVETPVFMPVGTQGTLKGVLVDQLKQENMNCQIMLANTYHLGLRPGTETLKKAGGLHNFMNWDRALLTDSGGFQMVSLLQLAEITEEGVKFQSPFDNSNTTLLTPEDEQINEAKPANIFLKQRQRCFKYNRFLRYRLNKIKHKKEAPKAKENVEEILLEI